ncbi:uncharacterized protein LOC129650185 isoform X2 [Bubalus kerabau]|uniref:uncharacterized protein LOC129650185 isoform X2 n=1 Tax=Bubalus carabanensis TaxID=3119969 RepID=UPI00244E6448|nr:uncharacterized protein LOC129650185 isoform X2 [Bubalus carabanensis]
MVDSRRFCELRASRIFLREEKRRHEALTPALESLDQKWHKSFSGTSLSCDPINLQEACKCSPRCLEEADNHRWVNNTLLTIIQWNSVIERCKRAHQKEAIYKSGGWPESLQLSKGNNNWHCCVPACMEQCGNQLTWHLLTPQWTSCLSGAVSHTVGKQRFSEVSLYIETLYDQPRHHIKRQRHYFATKVHLVKAMVFPVIMYGCESWTIKKAEHQRIDAFELWCWRRLLRVPWTARRSNHSILKEISLEYLLEGLMLKLKLLYFGHLNVKN